MILLNLVVSVFFGFKTIVFFHGFFMVLRFNCFFPWFFSMVFVPSPVFRSNEYYGFPPAFDRSEASEAARLLPCVGVRSGRAVSRRWGMAAARLRVVFVFSPNTWHR